MTSQEHGSGTVLLLGGTSGIGRALGQSFASRGFDLVITGRDEIELVRTAQDLVTRYGTVVHPFLFDAADTGSHPAFFTSVVEKTGGLSGAVVAFGWLGEQERAIASGVCAEQVIIANFGGAVSILTLIANYLVERGTGFIAGIGSVAGDRGRQSNYVYGASKGALALFLQGLRSRLYRHGVHVVTVKPGFVDTQMTYGLPGLFLVASPRDVADRILKAIERQENVVYVPAFWRYVTLIIRLIPERLFKRMKL